MIASDASIIAPILGRNAVTKHPMKRPIITDERRRLVPKHFSNCVVACFVGDRRIQPADGRPKSPDEHDVGERNTFRCDLPGREMRRIGDRIIELAEPLNRRLLNNGFGQIRHTVAHWPIDCLPLSSILNAAHPPGCGRSWARALRGPLCFQVPIPVRRSYFFWSLARMCG